MLSVKCNEQHVKIRFTSLFSCSAVLFLCMSKAIIAFCMSSLKEQKIYLQDNPFDRLPWRLLLRRSQPYSFRLSDAEALFRHRHFDTYCDVRETMAASATRCWHQLTRLSSLCHRDKQVQQGRWPFSRPLNIDRIKLTLPARVCDLTANESLIRSWNKNTWVNMPLAKWSQSASRSSLIENFKWMTWILGKNLEGW